MEDEKEIVDSPTDTEAETENTEETSKEEKPQFTESEKKLFARAKKAEADLKAAKAELAKNKPQPKEEKPESSVSPFGSQVETLLAIKDLDAEEITALESEARSLEVDPVKYIKSTGGKALLQSLRDKKKSAEASPEIGARSPIYKKYTEQDMRRMSAAELEKILPTAE